MKQVCKLQNDIAHAGYAAEVFVYHKHAILKKKKNTNVLFIFIITNECSFNVGMVCSLLGLPCFPVYPKQIAF